jgi:hypothetical protein
VAPRSLSTDLNSPSSRATAHRGSRIGKIEVREPRTPALSRAIGAPEHQEPSTPAIGRRARTAWGRPWSLQEWSGLKAALQALSPLLQADDAKQEEELEAAVARVQAVTPGCH